MNHPGTRTDRPVGIGATTGVELRKLVAQKRTRFTLLGCLLGPFIIAIVLDGQQRPPKDTLFGRHIHESGFALALFVLTFASQWVLPFVTAIVAGDIFATEDHLGTWKTLLTRSVSRTSVFAGKVVAATVYTVSSLLVLATATYAAATLVTGRQPMIGLTGQTISASRASVLVIAAWASMLPPLLAFTALAVMLSVVSRSPAVGVVGPIVLGLVSQLLGWLGGFDPIRRLLPTTPFDAWHGLFTAPRFTGLLVQGALVSIGWIFVFLTIAFVALRRRDITGG